MKKTITLIALAALSISQVSAQKFFTRSASITFFSTTPVEDIEAKNNQASAIVNMDNGDMAFTALMKSFQFKKALMQEHFNEKYVESDKFPKATFKGKITSPGMDKLAKNGEHKATVDGDLTIHGVTKKYTAEGTITKSDETLTLNSIFDITLADFNIKIPGPVKKKIAEKVKATIVAECKPYKK
jgi:polyisoprenoid-binding protein YceI